MKKIMKKTNQNQDSDNDNDKPWWTETELQRLVKELHYLKSNLYDQTANEYRDIRWMYFRREVLDKYRNNEYCDIGSEHIGFLLDGKKTAVSTANFINRNFPNTKTKGTVLMLQAQDYIFIPPTERPHWENYEISENQIDIY